MKDHSMLALHERNKIGKTYLLYRLATNSVKYEYGKWLVVLDTAA